MRALVFDLHVQLPVVGDDFEREVLHVSLDLIIAELATDEAKTVLTWFIAIWFFAASPMRRSVSEKES